MPIPSALVASARKDFDLTDPASQASLYRLAEALLALPDVSEADLRALAGSAHPLEARLAAKLVESRRFCLGSHAPIRIAVVFAMWGEHHRLLPRTPANPNGEDSLRVKLEQLAWVTRDTSIDWTLYAVDDGDPHDSGALAAEIAANHLLGERVEVLWLDRALPAASGPLAGMDSADDSRKGGAVLHGCLQAIADGADAVLYTDADGSVHLGQIGLLLRPHLERGARVVLGSRKHPGAVLVKQEGRWGIGIKVLRHMQRRVGEALFSRGIRDTQAAFKLYESGLLARILADATVYDFSFDTDWMLAAIAEGETLEAVPFAFVDSAAESASATQGPMPTWETLLKGLVRSVRKHGVPHDEAMARLLDTEIHDHRDLELLIDALPPELEAAEDAELGSPALMPAERLAAWIRERKASGLRA